MNGIDKLKEKILADARLKAKENIDLGIMEAKKSMDNAREESKINTNSIKEKSKRDAENRAQRILAAEELEGRKLMLKTKQDLVSEIFNKAIEKIKLMPLNEYKDILVKMILGSSDKENAQIILASCDKDKLGKNFEVDINETLRDNGKGLIKISEETRNFSGGFVLKKGNIEINNSFEAIISMKRDDISEGVVKILF